MLIIGDVHGMLDRYIDLVIDYEGPTLQLGDMGFDYEPLRILDPDQHKFFGGNHDNYDEYDDCPHALGNFGRGWNDIFYARGAWSMDWYDRVEGFDLWAQKEQLNYTESLECLEMYTTVKPKIVITHDCPSFLHTDLFHYNPLFRTNTSSLFDQMYLKHQPEVWIFGHHHKTINLYQGKTLFQCLGELTTIEI